MQPHILPGMPKGPDEGGGGKEHKVSGMSCNQSGKFAEKTSKNLPTDVKPKCSKCRSQSINRHKF